MEGCPQQISLQIPQTIKSKSVLLGAGLRAQVYKALVLPRLMYGAAVLGTGDPGDLHNADPCRPATGHHHVAG